MKLSRTILILLVGRLHSHRGRPEACWPPTFPEDAKYLWDPAHWQHGGFYLSWMKIATVWLLFLAWVGVADWVNRDTDETGLKWQLWNPVIVGSFMATMFLSWLIPWFWLNIFLLLGGAVAPVAAYIVDRNRQMPLHRQVLTRATSAFWYSEKMKNVGVKVAAEGPDPNAGGVPVKVYARGGGDPAIDVRRPVGRPAIRRTSPARKILYAGLKSRASAIVLDFSPTTVAVRYLVDGVWMPQEAAGARGGRPAPRRPQGPLRPGAQGAACQAGGQVRRGIRGAAERELHQNGQRRKGLSRAGHDGTHAADGLRGIAAAAASDRGRQGRGRAGPAEIRHAPSASGRPSTRRTCRNCRASRPCTP